MNLTPFAAKMSKSTTGVRAIEQHSLNNILLRLLQAGLSYLRWTQTVPMVLGWGFALLGLLAALFVGFQEQGISLIIWLTNTFPALGEWIGPALEESGAVNESGGISVTDETIGPWIIRAWAILAAVLMVIDWLRQRWTRNEASVTTLRRKLGIAMVASLIFVGIMVVGVIFGGAGKDITLGESVVPVLLIWLALFGVSAYSLTVGHVIGKVQLALDKQIPEVPQALS